MRLETAHVTNFRSVEDSGIFEVSPITCLVGKNEAGKSAILLALAALNPHEATPAKFDKERDYPRRTLTQYNEKHKDSEAVAVTTTWMLNDDEVRKITAVIGDNVLNSNVVKVSRQYQKPIAVEASINYKVSLDFFYKTFSLNAAERSVLASANNSTELISILKNLTAPTAKHTELATFFEKNGNVKAIVDRMVLSFLPKFMYFSSYDRMDGAIQIEKTSQLISDGQIDSEDNRGVKLFVEFLEYAGVPIADITNVSTYETFNAKLQAASNNITDQMLEYWTQNPDLNVVVRIEQSRPGDQAPFNHGTIARARIDNTLHRVDTPFSERSAGFVWFFSFLVKFAQVKNDASPVVLLLDEPGLTLHGKAQADLLRFFRDRLAPHHQVIYSTHSPFMVPADDLSSVRIVEDQIEIRSSRRIPLGTKVRDDVLTRDPDTLFPLQGALGYEITQSLFVGKHTLLVEGPSDILYIQSLSSVLKANGREGLDPRWTTCPTGGIDKIRPFVSLFGGNALQIAILSDQAVGDGKKVAELKKSEVLRAGHFYTMADFMKRNEADIEDILEPELFAKLLNECFGLDAVNSLTAEKLKSANRNTDRLVKQAESAFNLMPDTVAVFDHFTPSAWLIRNLKFLDKKSKDVSVTLERAEEIFSVFNKLLV